MTRLELGFFIDLSSAFVGFLFWALSGVESFMKM